MKFLTQLKNIGIYCFAALYTHKGSVCTDIRRKPLESIKENREMEGFTGEKWQMEATLNESNPNSSNLLFSALLSEGTALSATTGLEFDFTDWSREVYTVIPGAVYAGNRFPSFKSKYPPLPRPCKPGEFDSLPQISDVPRLSFEDGASRVEQLTSDPAIPGIGFFFPSRKIGLWIMLPERNSHGLIGIELEENNNRNAAVLRITSPGIRHKTDYEICNAGITSKYLARDFRKGENIDIKLHLNIFDCEDIPYLFERLASLRNVMVPKSSMTAEIPFSEAWKILEEKYNRENWVPEMGYYAIGVEPMRSQSIFQDWQAGWVGGLINTHALMLLGNEESQKRVWRTFDFAIEKTITPSGLFFGTCYKGTPLGDNFLDKKLPWHLVRKSGDALYYALSTLFLMRERNLLSLIKPQWENALRRCADAFVKIWNNYGQFGQFVNHNNCEIIVANSTCGAIIPAALVLAAEYFPNRKLEYMKVAKCAARNFDEQYLLRGFTCGGPGDIAQCPDSESIAGLLESYTRLYQVTREKEWLECAIRAAFQAASWVVSYDFNFPEDSTFAKMKMRSAGTVLANVQNKHSAPGICTHSGQSLFRLFRYSGNPFFLDLARDIAHALPQFMSREDRPIEWKIPYNQPSTLFEKYLKPGWMCERVNLTQWGPTEIPGEVFYYSCWSEISLMLSCAELPGVYAQPDTGRIWEIDHVNAEWADDKHSALVIRNPTKFKAKVRVHVETSSQANSTDLVWDYVSHLPIIEIFPKGKSYFPLHQ